MKQQFRKKIQLDFIQSSYIAFWSSVAKGRDKEKEANKFDLSKENHIKVDLVVESCIMRISNYMYFLSLATVLSHFSCQQKYYFDHM
mmetsp:Transcript_17574/g.35763  ORF Transcript_17574/g.35763 Transcript_17574/m.35763 type:complete len:87 (-) Transcript_17574:19-279(-)